MRYARLLVRGIAALGDYSAFVYLIVTAVIVYDVAARYLFNAPTYWALELSIILAGSQFMLGGLSPAARNNHVRIDGLYLLASPRMKRRMDIASALVAVFYLAFAAVYCWRTAIKAIGNWETTASIWDSPSPTIIKTVIALAFTLVAFVYAVNTWAWLTNRPLALDEETGRPET